MFDLFKKFALGSLLLFCAVFVPAFLVVPRLSQATFVDHQSQKNHEESQLFENALAAELKLALVEGDSQVFGRKVAEFIDGTDIAGVTLYTPMGLVAYSSPSETNIRVASPLRFQQALAGATPGGELVEQSGRTLLKTYSPLRGPTGDVTGMIALSTDVTVLLGDVKTRIYGLLFFGLAFTLLLYAPLLYMVRWLDGLLRQQYSALAASNEVLERQKEELARSNTELEQFAYTASHDLQEPLRKIQAFGDRLARKYGDTLGEDGLKYLDRMQNASGRMRGLIEDLLSFSRISSKGNPFVAVDLNETIAGVVGDLEVRINGSGGQVDIGGLPTLAADPLQMRQLLQNLIGNALKFSKPGVPPVVKVQSLVRGESVQLSVEDNGIGFDEQYAAKVFDVFQRLHGRGEYEGTGMGLAIVRKIAERHGGSAKAYSEAGKGATFVVTLPLKQNEGEPQSDLFSTQDIAELRQNTVLGQNEGAQPIVS